MWVLRVAVQEIQTRVKLKECSGEEGESGPYKNKSHQVVKLSAENCD